MIFVVECNLPGLTELQLAALQEALGEASRRLSSAGEPVRYVRSTYDAATSHCFCVFEAASRASVVKVNEVAQVPFINILRATASRRLLQLPRCTNHQEMKP